MPLRDSAEGIIGVLGRWIGWLFVDFALEIVLRGSGYLVVRYLVLFNRRDVDPDSDLLIVAGLLFWAIVLVAAYSILS